MLEKKTVDFIQELSSAAPVPGGGGASATVGAFATALGMMVANLTIGKKKYAAYEEEVIEIKGKLQEQQNELIQLVNKDAEAFWPLSQVYGMPKDTPEQKEAKEKAMEEALYQASLPPIRMMEVILDCMDLLGVLGEKGSRLAVSDVGVGILFAQAALEGASLNVFINTSMMKNKERSIALEDKANDLILRGMRRKDAVYSNVLKAIMK